STSLLVIHYSLFKSQFSRCGSSGPTTHEGPCNNSLPFRLSAPILYISSQTKPTNLMKNHLSLCIFLLLCISAHTQKLNTKDFGVEAWYQEMPTKPLDITYTTYDVTANGTVQDLNRLGYTLTDIKEDIKLEGYNRVNGGGS